MKKMENIETIRYVYDGKLSLFLSIIWIFFKFYLLCKINLITMMLDLPSGYITRFIKSDFFYISEDVKLFSKAVELIMAVWKSKVIFV